MPKRFLRLQRVLPGRKRRTNREVWSSLPSIQVKGHVSRDYFLCIKCIKSNICTSHIYIYIVQPMLLNLIRAADHSKKFLYGKIFICTFTADIYKWVLQYYLFVFCGAGSVCYRTGIWSYRYVFVPLPIASSPHVGGEGGVSSVFSEIFSKFICLTKTWTKSIAGFVGVMGDVFN